jgi:hypothetical protein
MSVLHYTEEQWSWMKNLNVSSKVMFWKELVIRSDIYNDA